MDRDTLPESVAIAHFHHCRLSSVLQILVVFSDRSERIDDVVATNTGVSAYDDVRPEYCALTNLGIVADAAIGTNPDVSANHSAFFNNCARMDDSSFIDYR